MLTSNRSRRLVVVNVGKDLPAPLVVASGVVLGGEANVVGRARVLKMMKAN